ncbi:RHS repeat domain-containing protein, partial [Flavobacterium sp. RNTU_13]|uniref:RHS repeat domain-containing protein n=1 Tax=Flavobacterium sp. RNTU_13 TaxID=3375145 RepID=UPI00398582BE
KAYRYGFQGQEKDDELKGEGNSLNYTFRMHDPRIGRFFAVDPLASKYPFYSPYQFSSNSPVQAIELEGLESSKIPNENEKKHEGGSFKRFFSKVLLGWMNIAYNVNQISTGKAPVRNPYADPDYGEKVVKGQQEIVSLTLSAVDIMQTAKYGIGDAEEDSRIYSQLSQKLKLKGIPRDLLRENYTKEVAALSKVGEEMLNAGIPESVVAKSLNEQRRALGLLYKDATPSDLRKFIYEFNIRRYGDKLGPTYEAMKKQGKTDAQIINSASRPLGDKKALGEALYKEFGKKIESILKRYDML